jgi:NADPH:quinone reductase-like Zn-dependent oxidoreductase
MSGEKNRAVCWKSHINPSSSPDEYSKALYVEEVPMPKLNDDEVLIKLEYAPVHPCDFLMVSGLVCPTGPHIPGIESVGKIVELGKNVNNQELKVGGYVYANSWPIFENHDIDAVEYRVGLWAEYFACKPTHLFPFDHTKVDPIKMAQFYVNPGTAYVAIKSMLNVQKGEVIIQGAAGSCLGQFVNILGKKMGFKTINLVRNPSHVSVLEANGFEHVYCLQDTQESKNGLIKYVMDLTHGKGADAALDPIGGFVPGVLVHCLKNLGKLIPFGMLDSTPVVLTPDVWVAIQLKGLQIQGLSMQKWWLPTTLPQTKNQIFQEVYQYFESGDYTPLPEGPFTLDQIQQAIIASFQTDPLKKKVVLKPF